MTEAERREPELPESWGEVRLSGNVEPDVLVSSKAWRELNAEVLRLRKENQRLKSGGCGKEGHTTATADEGTCHCMTCRLAYENKEMREALQELIFASRGLVGKAYIRDAQNALREQDNG
jgi:hypothetical protein